MKQNKIIIISIICIIIATTFFSTTANSSEFYYEDENTTVTFLSESGLSYEHKQMIANKLVYGYTNENQASTYRLCWLVGHDKVTNAVAAIEHKVDIYEPRCVERIYKVETCTACDYMNEELVSTTYIACCPED